MAPAPALDHQTIAGEIYRQIANALHGNPAIFELKGETPVGVLAGVAVAWDALVARLPAPEH
jgi:hypothetical protein